MIDFEKLTVADAAKLIEEVHDRNNFLSMDNGGVTVIVAKGDAAKAAMRGLRQMESRPARTRKKF